MHFFANGKLEVAPIMTLLNIINVIPIKHWYFRIGGEFSAEYNGPRDSDGIVKYMKSQVGPASRLYESRAKLEEALNKAKDVIVLGIFEKDDKSSLQTQFLKTADKLRESVNFGHVFTESVSDVFDLKALSELKTKTAPLIVLVRSQALKNKFEPSVVEYSSGDLQEFIQENYHGIVGLRTQNNNQDFRVSDLRLISCIIYGLRHTNFSPHFAKLVPEITRLWFLKTKIEYCYRKQCCTTIASTVPNNSQTILL